MAQTRNLGITYLGRLVYRGASPQSSEEMKQLAAYKDCITWLHLENGYMRLFGWRFAAQDWQVKHRRRYVYLPLSNWGFPHRDALRFAAETICASAGCYVSCKHGVDRTGLVIACWRVWYCNWKPDEAWAEAQKHGMHKFYLWLGWEKKFYALFK